MIKMIVMHLSGIDRCDLTTAEKRISELIIKDGYAKWVYGEDDEVYLEYVEK